MGHFCNAPTYQSTMAVYARSEQRPQHRCAALRHARAGSQGGGQPYVKPQAARAELSPVPNQLVWLGNLDGVLQSKLQTNPEGLAAGKQELN